MWFLVLVLCFLSVASMPYYVPLMGSQGGQRTLVLLDDMAKVATFSLFFGDLESRGHQLSYFHTESKNIKLKVYGEVQYDNIVIFAPTAEKLNSISYDDIIEFTQEGGNVLLAFNNEISEEIRSLAEDFGVSVNKKKTMAVDHFKFIPSLDTSSQHTVFAANSFIKHSAVLPSFEDKEASIIYNGVGLTIPESNILSVRILEGNPTSYSYYPDRLIKDAPESMGEKTLLVGGIQGRNNARVVISGSLALFSNVYFSQTGFENKKFAEEVSKWVFRESGVLRFRDIIHHKKDGTPPDVILHEKERPDLPVTLYPDPEITRNSLVYRIKDEIIYSMIVEEYKNGQWVPFSADDMQMEFVMLDAYVRKTLTADPKTGKFSTLFTAPDSYGIFKFRVLYRRTGYSVLHAETQVSIRPFKHNEYERFIFSAYPYYSSAFSASIAFFVFSLFFLFSSDK